MLPAFPKIEAWRGRLNREMIQYLAAQIAPMLGKIDRHIQYEGKQTTMLRHDDTVGHTPFHTITSEVRFTPAPLVNFTEEELLKKLQEFAEQLARGFSEHFYAEMNKVTAAAGNVVDAKGQRLSKELILKSLETMEHSFDPDGTWRAPTILSDSETIDRLMQSIRADNASLMEFDQALKKILDKKRDDFRTREIDRILAG